MKKDITTELDCGIYQTKESDDVIALREKLKAIELKRKRDVAENILNVKLLKSRGELTYYINKRPEFKTVIIDAMIEFNETMKKTGI
jgi:hypothetical protein